MLSEGDIFGRYAIVRELGRGGMGTVYEAEHCTLRKRFALKVLHEHATDPRSIERFVREGRAAASLEHRNVVAVLDLGVVDGRPFLLMELLRGEDLATTLARRAPLALDEAISLILAVCSAVDAMHRRSIVHRDIKPANIFLATDERDELVPKVLDFGVCRQEQPFVALSADSGLVGTPQYLSPEQVEGAPASPKSDQHAVAAVLYEALAGAPAYGADTLLATLSSIRDGRVRPLAERRGDLPEPLCAVVHRALAVKPEDRFDSVRAFSDALAPFAPQHALRTTVAPPAPSAPLTRSLPLEQPAPPTQRFGSPSASPEPQPPARASSRPALTAIIAIGSLAAWAAMHFARDGAAPTSATHAPPPPRTVIRLRSESASQRAPTVARTVAPPPLPAEPPTRTSAAHRARSAPRATANPTANPTPTQSSATTPVINSAPILD